MATVDQTPVSDVQDNAPTQDAITEVVVDMQAAAQAARHTLLKELWMQAHKVVSAGGKFTTTGSDAMDAEIQACWGPFAADKPYKRPWDGQDVPERFRVPSPAASPIGRAVVAQGLSAGVYDPAKRPRHVLGKSPSKWGWTVIDRALKCENLPADVRATIETNPLKFTQSVWKRCQQLEGADSGGGKTVVGLILDALCGGSAIEPGSNAPRKGGRKAAASIDTQASDYGDPGLLYLMGGK